MNSTSVAPPNPGPAGTHQGRKPVGMKEALARLRYRWWPDHLLGEILSKRWTETAIPVILLPSWSDEQRHPGLPVRWVAHHEMSGRRIGLMVLGLGLVMIVGGIDLPWVRFLPDELLRR
ncbi:MAG: hypothetical protein R3E55_13665 [Burkholderiaceae bacterium]